MLDENRFRTILQQLLEKSKADKVHWSAEASREGGEFYTVIFSSSAELRIYYNSPPEAPDFIRASLFISEHLVSAIQAENGQKEWPFLESLIAEARRCVFHFDEALNDIESALASDDIGLRGEQKRSNANEFLAFVTGKWRLKWSGPMNGNEVAVIDSWGGYHTGNWHYKLEMIEFTPGGKIKFWKHFGTDRPSELNDLEICQDGRIMSGKGGPPDGLTLIYERF